MPVSAAASAREILTGLHEVMAKREEPVAEITQEMIEEAAPELGSLG